MSKYLRNAPFTTGAALGHALVMAALLFVVRPMVPAGFRMFALIPSIIFVFIGLRLYRNTAEVTQEIAYLSHSIPGQFFVGFKYALLCHIRGTWHEIKLLRKQ